MFDPVIFGENVKQLKNSRKMTVQQLADKSGLSYFTIRGYLERRNSTSIHAVVQLSNALDVSPNELLRGMCPWPTELDAVRLYEEVLQSGPPDILHTVEVYTAYLVGTSKLSKEKDYGERLRACRVETGCSVMDLAKECGISPSTLSNIEAEQGKPSISIYLGICRRLRISPELPLLKELNAPQCPDALRTLTPGQIRSISELILVLRKK